jgi:hypothetical protein
MSGVAYEVRVTLAAGLAAVFERWMREEHIPAVLATGCFTGAAFERLEEGAYRTRYVAVGASDLERYLAEHAGDLRRHFAEHFAEGTAVARETWTTLATWPA